MSIKPVIFHDSKHGWCARIVFEGLPRTFSDFSSQLAAEKGADLQMKQIALTGKAYTQHELRQLGFCGAPGSYEAALSRRRSKFGVVNDDGSIKRVVWR